MKFTNEDLLKLFKVKLGDTVVIKDLEETNKPYKFSVGIHIGNDGEPKLVLIGIDSIERFYLTALLNYEYDVYTPKRLGDKKCDDYLVCSSCPLQHLKGCDNNKKEETLYTKLNREFPYTDDPIYKAYKEILDKEE